MKVAESVSSAALPVLRTVLKVLVVVNWIYGMAIVAIILLALLDPAWLMSAFKMRPSPEAERVLAGLTTVAALGIVTVPLHYMILRRLLEMVETVRARDPFVVDNASRLRAIAWILLVLNVISIIIGAIAAYVSTNEYPLRLNAGFSLYGWISVLLTFVLARVFSVGAEMRLDLEGTI